MESQRSEIVPQNFPHTPLDQASSHAMLDAFVGHWAVQGRNPLASVEAGDITGVETFEWLTGGHFLEYRWDRVLAFGWHHGVGLIGYDTEEEGHFAHFYDNLGFSRRYVVTIEPERMTLTGQFERGELTLSPDSRKLSIHWEQSGDGDHWKKLCDLFGTRTA